MARGEAEAAPLVEVVFETGEPDPEVEVVLDVDFLLFPAWPEVDHLVLRPAPDGRRRLVVLLPEDVELSYRFAHRRREGTVGTTPDELLHLRETAVADPAGSVRAPWRRRTRDLGDREGPARPHPPRRRSARRRGVA